MAKQPKSSATIPVWEDDPEPAVLVQRPVPDIAAKPLAIRMPKPTPKTGSGPGTDAFRFWTAAEALRRCAGMWAARAGIAAWQPGATLPIKLDEGRDLNAYYDRIALNFFHGPGPGGTRVFSGESPDVACHEMGHAILDAIKPQLWNAASAEAAAFHESFGDMSALLAALELSSMRKAVLAETGGRVSRSSRLSRMAEQLGTAIRVRAPDAVDRDSLRNAANSFTYQPPRTLPSSAPATMLSNEPHSFSRVFTGAFLDALADMLSANAAKPGAPTEAELAATAIDLAGILVAGVRAAPVVSNFYTQVAAAMVTAGAAVKPAYGPILRAVFVRRAILSLHSAAQITPQQGKAAAVAMAAGTRRGAAPGAEATLSVVALPAGHLGLELPLLVETPSQPRAMLAEAHVFEAGASTEPPSSVAAAQHFVDELFRRGRVDYAGHGAAHAALDHGRRLRSHKLVADDGAVRLHRCLFDCGYSGN